MRVLFVGLGSIGARNLEACRRARPGYEFAAWRSGRSGAKPAPAGVREITSASEARDYRPSIAWICTPTDAHREAVEALIPACSAFFVEKPLAHAVDEARALAALIEERGARFFHGCVMRHHPAVKWLREQLGSEACGRPALYQFRCGSDLSRWRPDRDYRISYSASAARGGGVGLDLIHEFDLATWFFGFPRRISGVRGRFGWLEISSDDVCAATLWHESVAGQVLLDYLRSDPVRRIEIVCESGTLWADLVSGQAGAIRPEIGGGAEGGPQSGPQSGSRSGSIVRELPISRDELHLAQATHVFSELERGDEPGSSAGDAARLVELVLSIPRATP